MAKTGVYNLVFISSATVYGESEEVAQNENWPIGHPLNPYGLTELIVKNML
jgi:UDP-glucose 4-epimerase